VFAFAYLFAGLIGGVAGLLFLTFAAALGVAAFVFWIWMLIDAIKSPKLDSTERIVWVLVIVFLHALGGLIYFFAGRKT
jgi:uncharacterized membrane protein